MSAPIDLSVVIPAYDEEQRLPRTLDSMAEWLARRGGGWEIVVVDDGSADGTRAVCERLAARIPELRFLGGRPHRGKGHAVRAGMLAARGTLRTMCDADGSMPVSELARLLAPIAEGRAAIAIGSRYVDGAAPRGQPLWRRTWSRLAHAIVRWALAPGVLDVHCGYKAFSADAAHALFSRARIDGWAFDLEILALASKLGWRVVEVGIDWRDDPRSRVDPLRDLGKVIRETLALERNLVLDVY
jgi:glycosyltransferase involved in cell wall biosynthesis